MPKWKVAVRTQRSHQVTVEAPDYSSAHAAARDHPPATDVEPYVEVDVIEQLGEPWCAPHGWYMDREGRPSDVVVVERAFGQKFDAKDVELLEERLTALGLDVGENWNGAGCASVSFRCAGRVGDTALTTDELARLGAPRES